MSIRLLDSDTAFPHPWKPSFPDGIEIRHRLTGTTISIFPTRPEAGVARYGVFVFKEGMQSYAPPMKVTREQAGAIIRHYTAGPYWKVVA